MRFGARSNQWPWKDVGRTLLHTTSSSAHAATANGTATTNKTSNGTILIGSNRTISGKEDLPILRELFGYLQATGNVLQTKWLSSGAGIQAVLPPLAAQPLIHLVVSPQMVPRLNGEYERFCVLNNFITYNSNFKIQRFKEQDFRFKLQTFLHMIFYS